jgi:gas vesicle protein
MANDDTASVTPVTTYTHVDRVRFVAGFATGLLTGAALALLLAPATGRETRQWMATQGRAARRRTGQLLHTEQLTAVIRRSGVLGLADMLRRTDAEKGEPATTAPPTDHVQA